MKEMFNEDIKDESSEQINTLDDIGLGFGNAPFMKDSKEFSLEDATPEDIAVIDISSNYKNLPSSDSDEEKVDSKVMSKDETTLENIVMENISEDTTSLDVDIASMSSKYKNIPNIDSIEEGIQRDIDKVMQEDMHEHTHEAMDIDAEEKARKDLEAEENSGDELTGSSLDGYLDVSDLSDESEQIFKTSDGRYFIDGDVNKETTIGDMKFNEVKEELSSDEDKSLLSKEAEFIEDDIAPYISRNDVTVQKKSAKNDIKEAKQKVKKDKHPMDPMKKKRLVKLGIIAATFAVVVSGILLVGRSLITKHVNFTDFSDTVEQQEQFDTESILDANAEIVQASDFNWDMIKGNPKYDENIYNILIIGGDIAGQKDARGNSDTLIIVSIDKNTKQIKLSSIMRDTYVPIPGHSDNKINSAYATGGVPLVRQVVEENFKVTIDSCVVVNYSTFVNVIEKLGGVKDVTINSREAAFINRECGKAGVSSNLVEGTFDLNAYQALHFARIRKISSDIYGSDDFGRTARQRFVLNQIFKQYKDLSYAQLAGILTSVMSELEIDEVLKKDIFLLAQVALKFETESLEEFRLPMDEAFSYASVPVPGSYMNMSVVKIDDFWQTNVDALHQFIYGNTEY